jgi:hypothetical protein
MSVGRTWTLTRRNRFQWPDLTPLGAPVRVNVPTRRAYQQVVDRFEAAVRANLGTRDRVPEICETIAASQRRSCGPSVPSTHTPVRFG